MRAREAELGRRRHQGGRPGDRARRRDRELDRSVEPRRRRRPSRSRGRQRAAAAAVRRARRRARGRARSRRARRGARSGDRRVRAAGGRASGCARPRGRRHRRRGAARAGSGAEADAGLVRVDAHVGDLGRGRGARRRVLEASSSQPAAASSALLERASSDARGSTRAARTWPPTKPIESAGTAVGSSSVDRRRLDELGQDAAGGGRVQEGDPRAAERRARGLRRSAGRPASRSVASAASMSSTA